VDDTPVAVVVPPGLDLMEVPVGVVVIAVIGTDEAVVVTATVIIVVAVETDAEMIKIVTERETEKEIETAIEIEHVTEVGIEIEAVTGTGIGVGIETGIGVEIRSEIVREIEKKRGKVIGTEVLILKQNPIKRKKIRTVRMVLMSQKTINLTPPTHP